jgi:hypothetical protein
VTQIFHSGQPSHGGDRKTSRLVCYLLSPSFSILKLDFLALLCLTIVRNISYILDITFRPITDNGKQKARK